MSQLKKFSATATPFGGEIIIDWELSTQLPENYRVILFKRSKVDISQAEIDSYFANISDLSKFDYNGLMVYDSFDKDVVGYTDFKVLNGVSYYYKAVFRDETTGEVSPALAASAIPQPNIKISIKDGKEIVKIAVEKMFDNISNVKGDTVKLGRDIKVVKQFCIDPISENYVMIERVNGSNQYKFLGQTFSGPTSGDLDKDIIKATFMTSIPDRRDKVTNIFRGYKQFLIRLCKRLGCQECDITIEGDYYNPAIHGINMVGVSVIFALLIANKMKVGAELINTIIMDLEVEEDDG